MVLRDKLNRCAKALSDWSRDRLHNFGAKITKLKHQIDDIRKSKKDGMEERLQRAKEDL